MTKPSHTPKALIHGPDDGTKLIRTARFSVYGWINEPVDPGGSQKKGRVKAKLIQVMGGTAEAPAHVLIGTQKKFGPVENQGSLPFQFQVDFPAPSDAGFEKTADEAADNQQGVLTITPLGPDDREYSPATVKLILVDANP